MFCRTCHYDLRGQFARCPECGRAFCTSDARSYYTVVPGPIVRRVLSFAWLCLRSPVSLNFGLAAYALFIMSLPRPITCGGGFSKSSIDAVNLREISKRWFVDCYSNGAWRDFDPAATQSRLPKQLSPWTEMNSIHARRLWKNRGEDAVWLLTPLLVYAGLMTAAIWKRAPYGRWLFSAASVGLLLTVSAGSLSTVLVSTQWPGSHAYLADFVYVRDLTWMAPAQRGTTVIAYSRSGSTGVDPDPRRAVAFMDGRAKTLPTSRLEQMLAAQGCSLEP